VLYCLKNLRRHPVSPGVATLFSPEPAFPIACLLPRPSKRYYQYFPSYPPYGGVGRVALKHTPLFIPCSLGPIHYNIRPFIRQNKIVWPDLEAPEVILTRHLLFIVACYFASNLLSYLIRLFATLLCKTIVQMTNPKTQS
jgi:hypothetical protein